MSQLAYFILFTVLVFAGPLFGESTLEREVLVAANALRATPRSLIPDLKSWLPLYEGKKRRLGPNKVLLTEEGAAAVKEAIRFLERAKPVGRLHFSPKLARAARLLQEDQAKTGDLGHQGSKGSTPGSRMEKFAKTIKKRGENIAYGEFKDGRDVVLGLLVDDGVADRGHRTNLMDPDYRLVGVACGRHPKFRSMCVMDFAFGVK